MTYAGFWRRFGAFWLDGLCYAPITVVVLWFDGQTRWAQLIWFVPGLIIGIWFYVYLVQRYGGTPGKLLLNLRIVKVDGSRVGHKEAALRYAPMFILSLLGSMALLFASFRISDAEYLALGWQMRTERLMELAPGWYPAILTATQVWVWSEFVVMMTNRKRRALHDFIAGTVVVRVDGAQQVVPADANALRHLRG